MQAAGPITLGTLTSTGGDVDMTSTASTITGGTVVAYGSDTFAAYGNNTGPSVTSQTGSITLSSQVGIVDWGLSNAATTFTATSGTGGINVGTVTSGGTLTLQAAGPITLGTATSTMGAVDVSSSASTVTAGQINASGSVVVAAQDNNIDTSVISRNGSVALSSQTGYVDDGMSVAATGFTATSGGGNIAVGTVSTGGPLTLQTPGGINFGSLSASGTINVAPYGVTVNAPDVEILTRVGDDTLTSHIDDVEVAVWEFPVIDFERHLSRERRLVAGQTGREPMVNLQGSYEPDAFTVVLKRKK